MAADTWDYCRACLEQKKINVKLMNMFELWKGNIIVDDFTKLTGVEVSQNDKYSKLICHKCCTKLYNAQSFVVMVKKSDCALKSQMNEVSSEGIIWPKPIELGKNVNDAVFGNVQDVEIKQEVLSDDDYDLGADRPDDSEYSMEIKVEPEEITQPTPIKITVNDCGKHVVTILDADNESDPLNLRATEEQSQQIHSKELVSSKRRRLDKQNKTNNKKCRFDDNTSTCSADNLVEISNSTNSSKDKLLTKSLRVVTPRLEVQPSIVYTSDSQPDVTPKKRGRPKKVITTEVEKDIQVPDVSPKNRGRSRKILTTEVEKDIQEPDVTSNKRGRPKKVLTTEVKKDIQVETLDTRRKRKKSSHTNEVVDSVIEEFKMDLREKDVIEDSDLWVTLEPIKNTKKDISNADKKQVYENLNNANMDQTGEITILNRKRPIRTVVLNKLKTHDKIVKKENFSETEELQMDLLLEVDDSENSVEKIAKRFSSNMKTKQWSKTQIERFSLKYHGKAYISQSGRLIPEKTMGPPCHCKTEYCKYLALSEEQRALIFETFWSFGNICKQWAFIVKFTEKCQRRAKYTYGVGFFERDFSYKYYLPLTENFNGEKVRVCKIMFANTIASLISPASVWQKYENPECLKLKRGEKLKKQQQIQDDKVASVCKHFRYLQKCKLKLIKQRALGYKTGRITSFGVRKMFKMYKEWVDSDEFSAQAMSCKEYENILRQNISLEHIVTLQKGDHNPKPKQVEPGETIDNEYGTANVIFKPDNYDDDNFDTESVHSNFSDELQTIEPETNQKLKQIKESTVKEVYKEGSSSDESETDFDGEVIRDTIKTRKSTCDKKLKCEEKETQSKQHAEYKIGHIMGESLGKQILTSRGTLIILKPPCSCKIKCSEKISEAQREFVFHYFWSLGKRSKQWEFLLQYTDRKPTKTTRVVTSIYRQRKYRLVFYLPTTNEISKDAEKVEVCPLMFSNTVRVSKSSVANCWARYDLNNLEDRRGGIFKSRSLKPKIDIELNQRLADKEDASPSVNKLDLNSEDYTLRKKVQDDADTDQGLDFTEIDFVYRSLPWEEYLQAIVCRVNQTKQTGKKYAKAKAKIAAKSVLPPCSCTRGCKEKITEEQRNYLCRYFWDLGGHARRWAFYFRFTTMSAPNRYLKHTARARRVFKFYLPITQDFDGEKVQVCQKMFLNTLACRGRVQSVWQKFSKGLFEDKRGKQIKLDNEDTINSIKEHLTILQKLDPQLKEYKFRRTKWIKFKLIYRDYEKWLENSKYPTSCKPAISRYRILLYKALGLEFPDSFYHGQ